MPTIPSRFSSSAVAKYLPAIVTLLDNYGKSVTWVRPSGSTETFAARFRDAIRAQQRYAWDVLASEQHEKLCQIGADFTVAQHNDLVCFGQSRLVREELRSRKPNTKPKHAVVQPNALDAERIEPQVQLRADDAALLFSICTFLVRGLITEYTFEQTDEESVNSLLDQIVTLFSDSPLLQFSRSDFITIESVDSTVILTLNVDVNTLDATPTEEPPSDS